MSEYATTPAPVDGRRNLANAVAGRVATGYRVESQTDMQAVLVKGKKPNHILHLILTLVTAGLWLLVWIPLAIFGGEKRTVLTVDDYGTVLTS
jgi:hypothetical protein